MLMVGFIFGHMHWGEGGEIIQIIHKSLPQNSSFDSCLLDNSSCHIYCQEEYSVVYHILSVTSVLLFTVDESVAMVKNLST